MIDPTKPIRHKNAAYNKPDGPVHYHGRTAQGSHIISFGEKGQAYIYTDAMFEQKYENVPQPPQEHCVCLYRFVNGSSVIAEVGEPRRIEGWDLVAATLVTEGAWL